MATRPWPGEAAAGIRRSDWIIDSCRRALGLPPLPPVVTFWRSEEPVIPGCRFHMILRSERAIHAYCRATQDRAVLYDGPVPTNGSVGLLPLSADPIQLRLTLESRHAGSARHAIAVHETFIMPSICGPVFTRIDHPGQASVGGSFPLMWETANARCVRICVVENELAWERVEPPSGSLILNPSCAGRLVVQLVAEGMGAPTSETREIAVRVPRLRIHLLRPATQVGQPGGKVRFEWRIEGGVEASLAALARGEVRRVGLDHALDTEFGQTPEEFQLTARGHGGVERTVMLRAIPDPMGGLL